MPIPESVQQPELGRTLILPTPLTHRNKQGEVYSRTDVVQRQIQSTIRQDWEAVANRATVSDDASPQYLQEESLVYLVREALREEQDSAFRDIFAVLFRRCVKYIERHLSSLPPDRVEDASQNVMAKVTEKIMDLSTDAGDFFQVRFWLALKRVIITEYDKQIKELKVDEDMVRIDEPVEGKDGLEPALDLRDESISQEDLASLSEGLSSLKGRLRKVFILRFYQGWPIKSKDKEEPTLSSYFNVTPRTIQNWLEEAEAALIKWREGKRR